jgi:hypothetical protein
MGYADYFLIVWDYTKFARDSGIPVGPGRGSGAGSIVAYSLGITNIDPLKYSLLFERFLNPERVSMPDIDIDFCYERRQEVIDYVVGKYGSDHVAQIITFGTMAAHLAVRDVGRVLDIPYDEVDRIAKMIPLQLRMTIGEALKINPDLKAAYDGSPVYRELIDMAMKLEGMPRHASTHAAGVLITDLPVTEYVPLQKNDDVVTTQFPMGALEELGLLKMDFLGLRTLTVIKDTIDAVRENRGVEIDIDSLDMSDAGVYGMIGDGGTCGVFQLESGGMTQFMKELQPSGIEDIIAGGALFRPGPMDSIPRYIEGKANRGRVRYDHPALEHILDVTYGCIVYQEQVMQIVRDLAGYSLGMADLVRRAMSKKKHDVMERERANFVHGATDAGGGVRVAGAVRNGVPEGVANKIFDDMLDFASYAFPKAHATAYAVVAYQTAWLKYYYPVEFMAAILNSCMGNADRVAHYMREARQMGIGVMPPDINSSLAKFSVSGGNLRFGLAAIKNVGAGAVGEIIAERRRNGAFRSFVDFLRRAGQGSLNKRGIDSMVRCGAFDSMRLARSSLAAAYEGLLDGMQSSRRKNVDGQMGLFDGMGAPGPGPGPGFGSGSGSSPGSSPDSGGAGLGSGAGSGSGLGSGSSPGSGGSSPDSGVNLGSGGAGIMGAPGYGNRPGGDFGGGMADGLPSGTANGAANGSAGDPADGFARGAGGNPAAALGYGLANVPAGGLVNGCADVLANGSANDPANGSADSLANGFANAPANGSADSLANGFANVPANGCADSLANGLGAGAAPPGAPHPDDAHIQALPEFPQSVLLNMEKEMLGLYVSGHPLDGCIGLIRRYADCDTGAFTGAAPGADSDADASQPESGGPVGLAAGQPAGAGLGGGAAGGEDGAGAGRMDGSAADARPPAVADGQAAVIGGVISGVKTKLTKSGAIMAFATLEDMNGSVEILLFPKIYEKFGRLFGADNIVLVRGRVTAREDEAAKFICEDAALVCAAGQNIGAGVGDGGAWPSGAGVGVGVGAGAGLGEGEGGAWNGAGGAGASLGGCAGGAGSAGSTGSIVASGAAGGIGSAGSVAAGSGAFADAGGAQAMDAIEGRIAEWRRGWRDWGGRSGNGGYSGNGGHGGHGGYSGNSGYGGSGSLSQPDGLGAGGAPHGNGARDGVYGGAPYGAPMPEYGSARRPTQSPTQSPALSPMPSPMPERWQGAPAPAAAAGPGGQTLYIRVSGGEPKALMDSTLAALKFFSGRTPVVLVNSANRTKRALGAEYGVKLCEALVSECRERFGADGVKIK